MFRAETDTWRIPPAFCPRLRSPSFSACSSLFLAAPLVPRRLLLSPSSARLCPLHLFIYFILFFLSLSLSRERLYPRISSRALRSEPTDTRPIFDAPCFFFSPLSSETSHYRSDGSIAHLSRTATLLGGPDYRSYSHRSSTARRIAIDERYRSDRREPVGRRQPKVVPEPSRGPATSRPRVPIVRRSSSALSSRRVQCLALADSGQWRIVFLRSNFPVRCLVLDCSQVAPSTF